MTDHRTKLKTLLRELFQFDAADLDFGIYRVMNQRRDEIDEFIEQGLLDTVAQEFNLLQQDVVREKQEELAVLEHQVRHDLGGEALDAQGNIVETYTQIPLALRYIQKQQEITLATVSADAEAEIFNALYTFFARYYDRGDFVAKRRYSRTHKYAVPYNGEEVLLHWANRDQYYVKTSDTLTDYAFRIASHGGYRVRFKLAAADTEQGNVKGDKRYFFPLAENVAHFTSPPQAGGTEGGVIRGQLTLFFEYRPLTESESEEYGRARVQEKIIEAEHKRLLDAVPDVILRGLLATCPAGHEIPLLDLHLTRWTRKATSDYFIHKDLQGFLERELDFYLKNEVMRLDDLDTRNAARAEQYLTRLVVIRRIARAVIAFLAQVEDFEKALFEKPKFVLDSQWCVTLDRVPQGLWPQVAANDAQWAEWERLFGAQKPVGQDVILSYMTAHPTLTVDTALYDAAFKDALLAALSEREGGLEGQRDGLLIYGENFQALNLLSPRFREQVKCIHIDPPYNTQTSGFFYKNSYQHSSWLAMMDNRISASISILSPDGAYLCHIDENEYERLHLLFERNKIPDGGTIVWDKKNPMLGRKGVATQHEYVLWRTWVDSPIYLRSQNIRRIISKAASLTRQHGGVNDDVRQEFAAWIRKCSDLTGGERAYHLIDHDGRVFQSVAMGAPEPRQDPKFHIPLVHPITKKKCPVPGNGWSRTPETLQSLLEKNEIIFGKDETVQPRRKVYLTNKSKRQLSSVIRNARRGKTDVMKMGLEFPYCHPVSLYEELLGAGASGDNDIVLDFFAGSGTNAHAVINLNREEGSKRKYILVEQGDYFDTILKPRLQKIIYAADWKDGQPVQGSAGSSHALQYLRLESYEDTLDNLDLRDADALPGGLFLPQRDDYLLRYFLDHETRRSRLNVNQFATPFDYQLRVRRDGVERRVGVDLVETANLLLGLSVQEQRAYQHQERLYRVVSGKVGREVAAGEQSVLVIWRNTAGLDKRAETAFVQAEIVAGREFDQVYVNGEDSHIPGAASIEAVFMDAMRRAPGAPGAALREED